MKDLKNLISQMTLEEKAGLCSGLNFWYLKGVDRLGIPSIMVTDGPHGLRKQVADADHVGLNESVPATCFPTASALAATWNRDLIHEVGVALGEECRQEKVSVILGPGVNIKRSPLCGRNFEYFSEDPYLSGEMAKSHISGVQSQGVGTSIKHYAVNNQEHRRQTINAIVDERGLREIYLTPYEIAVKDSQPWTVMCAYNKVNGVYCAEHPYLMTEILKEEWGHEGLVVTDWGAMNERVEALKAGIELEMPGVMNGNDARIVEAVKAGELHENVVDQAVERILALIFKAAETLSEEFKYDLHAHHALARRVAGEGAVLLKNDGQVLPLDANTKVALIGRFAKHPRYQGAGSSLMIPTQLDTVYGEMVKMVGEENITYAPGYTARADAVDDGLVQEALEIARGADVVVVCAGLTELYETEGLDRTHIKMPPGHDFLIEALAAVHENVVVVLSNGSPVEMPWLDDVPSILEGYLGGQAGAGAIADILYGKVNPSGKLAETFPLSVEDHLASEYFPGGPKTVEYRESIFVGYRYFDTVEQSVLFPFGHGLSYTTFEYSHLDVSHLDGVDGNITVKFKVRNTGKLPGKETVQVYVHDVDSSVFRPTKELRGFKKVDLQPGKETEIVIELDHRAFAFYDVEQKDWIVEAGNFEILVGASSRDIRLTQSIQLDSNQIPTAANKDKLSSYFKLTKGSRISQSDFEALVGHPVPPNRPSQKGEFDLNTPLCDMQDSLIGRIFYNYLKSQMDKVFEADKEDTPTAILMEAIVREMPLRGVLAFSGGKLNRRMVEGLLDMINGKFFKGLLRIVKARK